MDTSFRKGLDTTDIDEARDVVGRAYVPHSISPHGDGRSFHAVQETAHVGGIWIDRLTYTSDVDVVPVAPLGSQYCIMQTLRGVVTVTSDGSSVDLVDGRSVVLDESRLFWMRWHPESLVCNLRLDAGSVHRFILDIIVDTVPSSTFELVAPETRSDRIRWQSVVRMLNQLAVLGPPDPAAYPIWSAEVERFAVSAMLTTHSNHVMEAVRPQANAAASQVAARQAAEYLRANCAEPIVLQGLGPKFGVSTRSIQLAFQQLYDCSPREYLREMRLQSAHLDLMSDPDAKITDIGFRWGFSTPGRFAREYRRRFGILPSEVVRQTTLEVKEQSLDVGGKS